MVATPPTLTALETLASLQGCSVHSELQSLLTIDTIAAVALDAESFYQRYYLQRRPVLVSKCFDKGSCSLESLGSLTQERLFLHPDVTSTAVELSIQRNGNIMASEEYPDELTSAEALQLLTSRRRRESRSTESLYAKISLTHSESLLAAMGVCDFLRDPRDAPHVPVAHPLLMKPGAFFCWAFVGEAYSGSKTHVDVMGSDAWLVVVEGLKLWAIVHPADKHFVVKDDGTFANLFDIDYSEFPQAHRARLAIFHQGPGESIFVPSDAPHAVINLTETTSITFNFLLHEGSQMWEKFFLREVDDSKETAIFDIVVHGPDEHDVASDQYCHDYVHLRTFLPARCWGSHLTSDFGCRSVLDDIHSALSKSHIADALARCSVPLVGVPSHFEVNSSLKHLTVHYQSSPQSVARLCNTFAVDSDREASTMESLSSHYLVMISRRQWSRQTQRCNAQSSKAFSKRSSHVGSIPDFPPLSVLLNQSWYFEALLAYRPLLRIVQERQQHSIGRESMWHYSRFVWKEAVPSLGERWDCSTYLFYSSPYIDGPVSLFPLEQDETLQTCQALAAASSNFSPHFEEFQWRMDLLLAPLTCANELTPHAVLDLGDKLLEEIVTKVLLHKSWPSFAKFCDEHCGLFDGSIVSKEWARCGVEKVMVLVLYFLARANVVGFHYSHQFSCVREPRTVCLSGSAAALLMTRVTCKSCLAPLLTFVCSVLEGLAPSSTSIDDVLKTIIRGERSRVGEEISYDELCSWLCTAVQTKVAEMEVAVGVTEEAPASPVVRERARGLLEAISKLKDTLNLVD